MLIYSEKEPTKILWYRINDIPNNNIHNFEYTFYLKHKDYIASELNYLKSINNYYMYYTFDDLFLEFYNVGLLEALE